MLKTNSRVPIPENNVTIRNQNYIYLITNACKSKSGKWTSASVSIGKIDKSNGMLIPNANYYEYFASDNQRLQSVSAKQNNSIEASHLNSHSIEINQTATTIAYKRASAVKKIGCREILGHIVKEIGLLDVIKQVFPCNWDEILTAAFYMVTESNIMYLIRDWGDIVKPPYGVTLDSKKCSELFASISFSQRDAFFSKWIKSRTENEYIAYDVTSISTTASAIEEAEMGYNRDKEKLPQINIGMYYGETTQLPVYYNLYNGSIVDKDHLIFMRENTKRYNIIKIKFVLDAGFVTAGNISYMIDNEMPFIVPLPMSRIDAKKLINDSREKIKQEANYINQYDVYGYAVDFIFNGLPLTAYLFYSSSRYADEDKNLHEEINNVESALNDFASTLKLPSKCKEYFDVTLEKTPTEISYIKNFDKIEKIKSNHGYFIFISSVGFATSPENALKVYKSRDIVEKAFDDLKNGMDYKRLRTHNSKTTNGKVFVAFLALIIRAYILNKKNQTDLKKISLEQLLSEIKKIHEVEYDDGKCIPLRLTKRQKQIFAYLDVPTEIFNLP